MAKAFVFVSNEIRDSLSIGSKLPTKVEAAALFT